MNLPNHIAIVMDGNGRWAEQRHRPRTFGHQAGVRAARDIVKVCAQRHIRALTLFAFSSENWNRPVGEVKRLMDLFLRSIEREVDDLHRNGVRLRFIGDRTAFSPDLREGMARSELLTAANDGLQLAIAVNYGGRWDIAQAARQMASEVKAGHLDLDEISETNLARRFCLADFPEPDLLIRTGGERRISNFLLWQLAYTELYFCDTLWPDFDADALDQALSDFASRQRRFGRTGKQVKKVGNA
ncbi:MAG: polyprenyl diphosphate synthase [Xanthomonadales bacterium]|nr:polyprenyl diphosphate synthase [Xanthomonadales bacterium]